MNLLKDLKITKDTKKKKYIDETIITNRVKRNITFKVLKAIGKNFENDFTIDELMNSTGCVTDVTDEHENDIVEFSRRLKETKYRKIFDDENIIIRCYEHKGANYFMFVSSKVGVSLMSGGIAYLKKLDDDYFENTSFSFFRSDGKEKNRMVFLNPLVLKGTMFLDNSIENYTWRLRDAVRRNNEISGNINYIIDGLKAGKGCARAFETKKNIPQKTLDIMKSSSLNEHFTFVEIDEDVDLEKFSMVEDEINSIPKYLIDSVDVELRFKKLGKHGSKTKIVTGLYFPTKKTICVEVKDTKSFVHELGHAIDHRKGYMESFSTSDKFKSFLRRTVDRLKENEIKNIEYFATPTEVFARAFEVWLSKNYKDFSNVCKTTFNNIEYYFTDSEIKEFDELLRASLV